MGGAARPLHDPGNHRSIERGSNPHAARCGSLRRPAKTAGERHVDAALTPQPGTRPGRLKVLGRRPLLNNPDPLEFKSPQNPKPRAQYCGALMVVPKAVR